MIKEIDARGFPCPIPVVKTKNAIEENLNNEVLTVLVESAVSEENVSRLARSKGYSVKVEEVSDSYRLVLTPPGK